MNPTLPDLITIQEAARKLSVSEKTLRRWEKSGLISSIRTAGGHRRYDSVVIEKMARRSQDPKKRVSSMLQPQDGAFLYKRMHVDQKKVIGYSFGLLFFLITGGIVLKGETTSKIQSMTKENIAKVLAAQTTNLNPTFNINVPAIFKEIVQFAKDVTVNGQTTTVNDLVVRGNLNLADGLTLPGDLAVNGGDITTNQTTFNLVNTGVTTLNIGGAATTLSVGAATGTTTINNNLVVKGSQNVSGAFTGSGTGTFAGTLTASGDFKVSGTTTLGTTTAGATTVSSLTDSGALSVSGNATFGNITEINGVTYAFPDTQGAANSSLTNDGAGNLTWLDTSGSGSVGFWTRSGTNLSPTNAGDSVTTTGHVAFGNAAAVDDINLLNSGSTTSNTLTLEETPTDYSNDYLLGVANYLDINPSGTVDSSIYGIDNEVVSRSGNSQNIPFMQGIYSLVNHQGSGNMIFSVATTGYSQNSSSGTVSESDGVVGQAANQGSGTVTLGRGGLFSVFNGSTASTGTAKGLESALYNYSSGAITTGYSIFIPSAINAGGGTFTNNYGLYVEDQSAVGSSNSYNIYSAGATSKNYFAGNVIVGSGSSFLPDVSLGSDLGSASKKFNNIYAANLNIDSGVTSSGQILATYNPADTTFAESSIRINVTTPSADEQMLGVGQAGEERASIDAEGDLTLGYDGTAGSSVPTSSNPFMVYGHNTSNVASISTTGILTTAGNIVIGSTDGVVSPGNGSIFLTSNGAGNTNIYGTKGTVNGAATANGIMLDVGGASGSPSTVTVTSGEQQVIQAPTTFNPTSGTGIFDLLTLKPIINQTGGANGISRGLYINPTLTAATDFRAVEIANNANYAIYQSGASATNYFAGNVAIATTSATQKLTVQDGTILSNHTLTNNYTLNGVLGGNRIFTNSSLGDAPILGVSMYNGAGTSPLAIKTNPLGVAFGDVGVVGAGLSTHGGGVNATGIYGYSIMDAGSAASSSTNNVVGGIFLTELGSTTTSFGGSMYGVYAKSTSAGAGSSAGSIYGSYNQAVGKSGDTTYGGYFTAASGTTNYGVYSNAGTNYFNGSTGIGDTTPDATLDIDFTGTTTNAFGITADSLTSGKAAFVTTAATAFTGNLVDITSTGGNAANTGTLLHVQSAATDAETTAMITNLGTGRSFRVNDETSDSDTTPFVIDASGNVGIGTTTPNTTWKLSTIDGNIGLVRDDTNIATVQSYWGSSTVYGLNVLANASSSDSFPNGYGVRLGHGFSVTPTSGTVDIVQAFSNSFSPTSGTAVMDLFGIRGTINQTGGASGITRGIYVTPTLTAAADFRGIEIADVTGHKAIYTNAGNVILNAGNAAATQFAFGTTSPVGKFHVTGAMVGKALGIFDETGDQDVFTASTSGTTRFRIANAGGTFLDLPGTGTGNALCHTTAGGVDNEEIVDCTSAPAADYAEQYPVEDGVSYGDIVAVGSQNVVTKDGKTIKKLVKSTSTYQTNIVGIVSNNYGDFTSAGYNINTSDNPMPVALNGRVPVKVSPTSQAINPGDFVTTSSDSGRAMKATQSGYVIGKALEAWTPNTNQDTVMVFVNNTYYIGDLSADGSLNGTSTDGGTLSQQPSQSTQIDGVDTQTQEKIASLSAEINNIKDRLSSLETANLTATSSAVLGIATDSATLSNLNVLGNTILGDTVVNGKLNIGTLSFDNANSSIDSIGKLKIQSLALDTIEFQNDSIEMDKNGNFNIKKGVIIGNDNIRGSEMVHTGNNEIQINKAWTTVPVSITANANWDSYVWVDNITKDGFTIHLKNSPTTDSQVMWNAIW